MQYWELKIGKEKGMSNFSDILGTLWNFGGEASSLCCRKELFGEDALIYDTLKKAVFHAFTKA